MDWNETVKIFDDIVAKCPRFERKGKTVPHTSANGYMFSLINKESELGFRFSKEIQKKYLEAWNSTSLKSHGATMQGYVKIPENMLDNLDQLAEYLNESYDHVMSLPPK